VYVTVKRARRRATYAHLLNGQRAPLLRRDYHWLCRRARRDGYGLLVARDLDGHLVVYLGRIAHVIPRRGALHH